MAFVINDLKKSNIEYDEEMVNSFLDYVRGRFISLNVEIGFFPDVFIKLMKLYVIPGELYDYLKRITGIDVNDKYVMNDYYVLINSFDVHELPSLLLNNNKTKIIDLLG